MRVNVKNIFERVKQLNNRQAEGGFKMTENGELKATRLRSKTKEDSMESKADKLKSLKRSLEYYSDSLKDIEPWLKNTKEIDIESIQVSELSRELNSLIVILK
eukprot:GHVP01067460.1.p2 GENE.GHVP01067460.1~~GHVP01067460.1.p2  ORF type:complete len:103 (+),score=18.73 GHVP01067460.1:470-778(+)